MKIVTSRAVKLSLLVFLLSSGFFIGGAKVDAALTNWTYSKSWPAGQTCNEGGCTDYSAGSSVVASFSATDGGTNVNTYAPGATVSVSVLAGTGDGNSFNGWDPINNGILNFLFGSSTKAVGADAYYGSVHVAHCAQTGSCTGSGTFTAPTVPGTYAINLRGWWYKSEQYESTHSFSSMTFKVANTSCPVINGTVYWNASGANVTGPCSQYVNATVSSGGSKTVTNTASGYTGSATFGCNGSWTGPTAVSCTAVVPGVCGTANGKTYPSGTTGYSPDTQCSVGVSTNPQFPPPGGTYAWLCNNNGSKSGMCQAWRATVAPASVVTSMTVDGSTNNLTSCPGVSHALKWWATNVGGTCGGFGYAPVGASPNAGGSTSFSATSNGTINYNCPNSAGAWGTQRNINVSVVDGSSCCNVGSHLAAGQTYWNGSACVVPPGAPTVTVSWTPSTITAGNSSTLKVTSSDPNATCVGTLTGVSPVSTMSIPNPFSNTFPFPTAGTETASGSCTNAGGTVTASAVLTINSVPVSYKTLSVYKSGAGSGTVTGSGINCGATCSASYVSGTSVTLTASPTSGTFSGWSGACTNTTGTCTVSMTAAKSVTATFTVIPSVINGVCNATHYNCVKGSTGATASYANQWQWWCNGSGGGSNVLCAQMKPVNCVGSWSNNGTCSVSSCGQTGVIQQTYTITTPAAYGGATCPSANGAKQWGGTSCSTVACPVNASCNPTHYNCNSGSTGATGNYADQWQWWCNGSNGGSNVLCAQMKPPTCSSTGPGTSTTATSGTYSVYAYGVSNTVTAVNFPTWGDVGGQDDRVSYPGVNQGGGTWRGDINMANHKAGNPEYGNINVHIYMNAPSYSGTWCGTANFTRIPSYTLSVFKSGTGSGTVTSTPSSTIVGVPPTMAYFISGTSVTLTATPTSGSIFDSWFTLPPDSCLGTGPCTVSMTASKSVIATFTLKPVQGMCGTAANNGTYASAPTTGLCNPSTPTVTSGSFSGTGPWSWTCDGMYGGGKSLTCRAAIDCAKDCSVDKASKICSDQSFSDNCGGTCPNKGTRSCGSSWKEVVP